MRAGEAKYLSSSDVQFIRSIKDVLYCEIFAKTEVERNLLNAKKSGKKSGIFYRKCPIKSSISEVVFNPFEYASIGQFVISVFGKWEYRGGLECSYGEINFFINDVYDFDLLDTLNFNFTHNLLLSILDLVGTPFFIYGHWWWKYRDKKWSLGNAASSQSDSESIGIMA